MPPITSVTPIVTPAQFVGDYPEFSDTSKYPVGTIQYWLAVATVLLDPLRWGTMLQIGVELLVAHELVLETQAQSTALVGGWPGISRGPISSEAAGAVNLSYDSVQALETEGGNWNLTVYGTRFLRWARMAGAGPLQIGPGCGLGAGTVPGANGGSGAAWSGPNCLPGWFGS